jgi:hypothetical protein
MKAAIAVIALALLSVSGASAQVNPNTPFPFSPSTPTLENTLTCSKTIGFAVMGSGRVDQFMPVWIQNWVKKNAKKNPDICFSEVPRLGENFIIVLSNSSLQYSGLMPVTRTYTDTTPVSGTGISNGDVWRFDGTLTTTTRINYAAPYTDTNTSLYATAYNSQGRIVAQRYHVYSVRSGGEGANTLGYNLGNMLTNINARGSLINRVVKDIAPKAKKVKKTKSTA